MKRYTSSQVRERFADMLDAAERGEDRPDGRRVYLPPATVILLDTNALIWLHHGGSAPR